jgi:FdhE protein
MTVTAAPSRSAIDWDGRRRRAASLRERLPYAAEVLGLYGALLDAQERAAAAAIAERVDAATVLGFIVERSLPGVMEATMRAGTELLREAALLAFHENAPERIVGDWLAGREQSATDRYLARAASEPVLEALPTVAPWVGGDPELKRCPACGGLPQLSYTVNSGEALVTAPRRLLCSRCGTSWAYPRLTCAACGETETGRMPVYRAAEDLAYLRVDACETCRLYLISVEVTKEPSALPVVDELAALPLDLDANERGLAKITPNLMGF